MNILCAFYSIYFFIAVQLKGQNCVRNERFKMATITTVVILRSCIFMGCEYIGKPIKMCLLPLFTKHVGQSGETFFFPRVFFPNCNKLRGSERTLLWLFFLKFSQPTQRWWWPWKVTFQRKNKGFSLLLWKQGEQLMTLSTPTSLTFCF